MYFQNCTKQPFGEKINELLITGNRSPLTGYSAHLSRSSGENFQGAKLFSVLLNIAFHSCGALLSSIIKNLRNCTMISNGSILTGHSSTHAWHVVQARSSSSVI